MVLEESASFDGQIRELRMQLETRRKELDLSGDCSAQGR